MRRKSVCAQAPLDGHEEGPLTDGPIGFDVDRPSNVILSFGDVPGTEVTYYYPGFFQSSPVSVRNTSPSRLFVLRAVGPCLDCRIVPSLGFGSFTCLRPPNAEGGPSIPFSKGNRAPKWQF